MNRLTKENTKEQAEASLFKYGFTNQITIDGECNTNESLDTLRNIANKLGQLEDLMEKYEIETIEDLEKIVSDFDSCCQDLVNIMGLVTGLQSFIDSKGLTVESKAFIKKHLENLKRNK